MSIVAVQVSELGRLSVESGALYWLLATWLRNMTWHVIASIPPVEIVVFVQNPQGRNGMDQHHDIFGQVLCLV
jgi:hypothetical protein